MAQLKSTNVTGNLSVTGNILASKIIKFGGTANEILLASGDTATLSDLGAGTVTSVGISSNSLTVTSSPITSAGSINIEHPTTTVTTADIYKIGKDDKGHVVIGDKITAADLGLSDAITGSGDQYYIPRFGAGGKILGNSELIDNGSNIYPNANLGSALGHTSYMWDKVFVRQIELNREKGVDYGRISFYKPTMYTWFEYMSPKGVKSPTGANTIEYGEVNSWARRSLIEPNNGYGWIWEAASNSENAAPAGRMALSSTTGNLKVAGSVTANGFKHSDDTTGNNNYVLLAGGGTKALTDFAVSSVGDSYLPLAGGAMTGAGPITYPTASGNNKDKNYISAGGGYAVGSGKEGLKILALEQGDATMGLGVDLTGGPYELTVATSRKTNATASKIAFATHTVGTTAYKTLATLLASDAENPVVTLNVNGTTQAKGFEHTNLTTASGKTKNDYVLLAGGGTKALTDFASSSVGDTNLPLRLQTYTTASNMPDTGADEAMEQGWYYIARGDTNRPPFKNVVGETTDTDYRIMATAHSASWVQQIATNFRSNDIFIRRKQDGAWQGWTSLVKMEEGLAAPTGTPNAIPRWEGTKNSTLKNSGVTIDDSNNLTTQGNITLYKPTGISPKLIFLRGTANDGQNDWAVFDENGALHFENRGSDNKWTRNITLLQDGGITLFRNGQIRKTNAAGNVTYYYTLPDESDTLATETWVETWVGKNVVSANDKTITIATSGTGLSCDEDFTLNQNSDKTITITLNSAEAGNRLKNKVVIAADDGQINSEKYAITKSGGVKASWQYNTSTDCVELAWA